MTILLGVERVDPPMVSRRVARIGFRKRQPGVQLLPQAPSRHCLLQHSPAFAQLDPMSLHSLTAAPHVGGDPPHRPEQQSAADPHVVPSAWHGAVHTVTPASPCTHEPRQQSPSTPQIAPRGRHCPAPKSQRSLVVLQATQHGDDDSHASPVARHVAAGSSAHFPSMVEQTPEQQSALATHASPSCVQKAPPQVPPWQAIEQHSIARLHCAPSALQ